MSTDAARFFQTLDWVPMPATLELDPHWFADDDWKRLDDHLVTWLESGRPTATPEQEAWLCRFCERLLLFAASAGRNSCFFKRAPNMPDLSVSEVMSLYDRSDRYLKRWVDRSDRMLRADKSGTPPRLLLAICACGDHRCGHRQRGGAELQSEVLKQAKEALKRALQGAARPTVRSVDAITRVDQGSVELSTQRRIFRFEDRGRRDPDAFSLEHISTACGDDALFWSLLNEAEERARRTANSYPPALMLADDFLRGVASRMLCARSAELFVGARHDDGAIVRAQDLLETLEALARARASERRISIASARRELTQSDIWNACRSLGIELPDDNAMRTRLKRAKDFLRDRLRELFPERFPSD